MTAQDSFTDEEWTRLKRAPFVAGMAISFADPGGPIEAFQESAATLRVVMEAAESREHGELVRALAAGVAEDAKARHNPLADFKPRRSTAAIDVMDELTTAQRLVVEKATPEEAADYRAWLLAAAQEAANAAKEGGFLGFHAQRVSEGEQRMLDRLNEALAV